MEIEKLYNTIGEYRKLNERSSLPIYIKNNNAYVWFNYILEEDEYECVSTVIFVLSEVENIPIQYRKEIKVELKSLDMDDIKDEESYYMQFMKMDSIGEIFNLISQTEEAPFIELYKQVINFINDLASNKF